MIEAADGVLHVDAFLSVILGITVLFIGKCVNSGFAFLLNFKRRELITVDVRVFC